MKRIPTPSGRVTHRDTRCAVRQPANRSSIRVRRLEHAELLAPDVANLAKGCIGPNGIKNWLDEVRAAAACFLYLGQRRLDPALVALATHAFEARLLPRSRLGI